MKKYESQIAKAKEKAAAWKVNGRAYSASQILKAVNRLEIAVGQEKEAEAEKAWELVQKEMKEYESPVVEAQVKDSLSKKK